MKTVLEELSKKYGRFLAILLFNIGLAALWVMRNVGTLTSDWPVQSAVPLQPHLLVATFSIPLLALILTSALTSGGRLIRAIRTNQCVRLSILIGIALFAVYCLVLTAILPGFWNEDAVYTNHMVRAGWWSGWYSPIHPFLVTLLMQWFPSAIGLTLFLSASVSFLIGTFSYVALRLGANRIAIIIIATIVALMPSTLFTALMPIRDSFFTVFFLLYGLAAFWISVTRGPSCLNTIALGVFAGVLTAYRIDAIAATAAAPLLVFASTRLALRLRLRLCGIYFTVLIGTMLAISSIPDLLGPAWDTRAEREYRLTLIANPLGYLIKNGFVSPNPEQDREVIERVFKYEDLVEHWYPYNIAVFYHGHWNQSSTDGERDAAFRVSVKLFLNNPGRFLESRVLSFIPVSGLAPNEPIVYFSREKLLESRTIDFRMPTTLEVAGTELERWLRRTQEFTGIAPSGRFLFWNLTFWILVLLTTTFFWRTTPFSAVFAALVLLRACAVFVGAPATFIHYYFSIFLGGALVFALTLGERSYNRATLTSMRESRSSTTGTKL